MWQHNTEKESLNVSSYWSQLLIDGHLRGWRRAHMETCGWMQMTSDLANSHPDETWTTYRTSSAAVWQVKLMEMNEEQLQDHADISTEACFLGLLGHLIMCFISDFFCTRNIPYQVHVNDAYWLLWPYIILSLNFIIFFRNDCFKCCPLWFFFCLSASPAACFSLDSVEILYRTFKEKPIDIIYNIY